MIDPTIAASAARALMNYAVSRGGSRSALAERSHIDPAQLEDSHSRIPFARYVALMRAGQELCGDPALALHYAEAVDVTEISFASSIGAFAGTIGEGFTLLNRYARLIVDVECGGNGDRFQIVRGRGQLFIEDARMNPNDFPELTESTFVRAVCVGRRSYGDLVKAVHVTHEAPAYRAEYDRIFRLPVVFGASRNALLVDERVSALFAKRSPSSSPTVAEVLEAHADMLLARLTGPTTTRDAVERLVVKLLPTGEADLGVVTRALGVSRQTLFRRLKAEGTTFEKVVDQLRHRLALEYLNDRRMSVSQAGALLGFSAPAAFSRAFKRWTGSSPRRPGSRAASDA